MLAFERSDVLLDFKDRLLELHVQRGDAGKSGDWKLADSIEEKISDIRARREVIWDADTVANP